MVAINITSREIMKVLLPYFHDLLDAKGQVISGLQNNVPLPLNAIVLFPISEENIDKSVDYFNQSEGEGYVLSSVKMRLQVDFYGDKAHERARKLSNVWRDFYTTEKFSILQPLYCEGVRFMQFVNEKSQFENRYSVDLFLQYNTAVTYNEDFVTNYELSLFNI